MQAALKKEQSNIKIIGKYYFGDDLAKYFKM